MKYTNIEEQVKYGLDSIDPKKEILVNLKDLLYIYKTIEEMRRFFHQPLHYPSINDVKLYMELNGIGDGFKRLNYIYCEIFEKMFTQEIKDIVEDDNFYNPLYPYYYEDNDGEKK